MPDSLRQLVNDFDRANAREHRLTGEAILPNRGGAKTRHLCVRCRRDPYEAAVAEFERLLLAAESAAQRAEVPRPPRPHLDDRCPHCGGQLVEVTR